MRLFYLKIRSFYLQSRKPLQATSITSTAIVIITHQQSHLRIKCQQIFQKLKFLLFFNQQNKQSNVLFEQLDKKRIKKRTMKVWRKMTEKAEDLAMLYSLCSEHCFHLRFRQFIAEIRERIRERQSKRVRTQSQQVDCFYQHTQGKRAIRLWREFFVDLLFQKRREIRYFEGAYCTNAILRSVMMWKSFTRNRIKKQMIRQVENQVFLRTKKLVSLQAENKSVQRRSSSRKEIENFRQKYCKLVLIWRFRRLHEYARIWKIFTKDFR
jgi:hypothetical protein